MAEVRRYSDCERFADGREYIDDRRWLDVVRVLVGLDPIMEFANGRGTGSDTRDWQAPCLRES